MAVEPIQNPAHNETPSSGLNATQAAEANAAYLQARGELMQAQIPDDIKQALLADLSLTIQQAGLGNGASILNAIQHIRNRVETESAIARTQSGTALDAAELSAAARERVRILSQTIDLDDPNSIKAFATALGVPPADLETGLRLNPDLVEGHNSRTAEERESFFEQREFYNSITEALLEKISAGEARGLLERIKNEGLAGNPQLQQVLREIDESGASELSEDVANRLREAVDGAVAARAERSQRLHPDTPPSARPGLDLLAEMIESYSERGQQQGLKAAFQVSIINGSSIQGRSYSMDERVNEVIQLVTAKNPEHNHDPNQLREKAQQFLMKLDAREIERIDLSADEAIHKAMSNGYYAMALGDREGAIEFANEVEGLLVTYGYNTDAAQEFGARLRAGARHFTENGGENLPELFAKGTEKEVIDQMLADFSEAYWKAEDRVAELQEDSSLTPEIPVAVEHASVAQDEGDIGRGGVLANVQQTLQYDNDIRGLTEAMEGLGWAKGGSRNAEGIVDNGQGLTGDIGSRFREGNGKLSLEEIKATFQRAGMQLSELDTDQSGNINEAELDHGLQMAVAKIQTDAGRER